MLKMELIDIMKSHNLLDWKTIYIGLKKNCITKSEAINYAVNQLDSINDDDYNITLLAGADNESSETVLNLIYKYINSKNIQLNEHYEEKRLLLSYLLLINEAAISEQEKIDKLQEVYVKFNYPDEMAKCSIYYTEPERTFKSGDISTDPINEMKNVINKLINELE